jgi:UDP-glucose 4-epimerase
LVNVVGTVNVAEAVRLTGVARLLHASSLAVNDRSWPQTEPITEDFPSSGNDNIYGASKVAAEHLLRAYSTHYRFELAMLRFAGVYGYGHFAGGSGVGRAMFNLVRDALEHRVGTIDAGIPDSSEMIYVKDVARAVADATHAARLPHDVYNVGSGKLDTPESILEALRRVVPDAQAERPPDAVGGRQTRHQPFDLGRSSAELGFEPQFDLEAGIRDLAAAIAADTTAVESQIGREA